MIGGQRKTNNIEKQKNKNILLLVKDSGKENKEIKGRFH